jgi:hypothetical protein
MLRLNMANNQEEKQLEEIFDYQAVVGSPMYTALATRPGAIYAVTVYFQKTNVAIYLIHAYC